MKHYMYFFAGLIAMMGVTPGVAVQTYVGSRAASSVDLNGMPAERVRQNVNYEKYETRTTGTYYTTEDAGNLYYTKPVKRSDLYKQYESNGRVAVNNVSNTNVRTTRAETVRSQMRRKYFLAHPFFQPTKGKFGSVTDLGYTTSKYDITLNPQNTYFGNDLLYIRYDDVNAKWKTNQFTVKEDLSFGITDTLAVLGMVQYDKTKYKLDWSDSPDDSSDDSGVNLFGIGGQYRFLDNADWIADASLYFQHQKDIANNFILELKAGYKVSSTTVYGLGRAWYVNLIDGDMYGNYMEGVDPYGNISNLFLVFKDDVSNIFYAEGGLGVFSVLDEDWTLNVEGVFGYYDWHNQASLKAAIGWQPNDWFALNLYARTSVYDSADDKSVDFYSYVGVANRGIINSAGELEELVPTVVVPVDRTLRLGDAKLSNNSETKIGVQAIFMF